MKPGDHRDEIFAANIGKQFKAQSLRIDSREPEQLLRLPDNSLAGLVARNVVAFPFAAGADQHAIGAVFESIENELWRNSAAAIHRHNFDARWILELFSPRIIGSDVRIPFATVKDDFWFGLGHD